MAVDAFLGVEKYGGSAQAIDTLKSLLLSGYNSARPTPLRIVADGDSQETSPGGEGWQWLNSLNYYLYLRYGNTPESQIGSVGSIGSGAPAAGWCLASATGGNGIAGLAATNRYPFGREPSANNRYNTDSFEYGALFTLQANALTINAAQTHIPRTIEMFTRSGMKCNIMLPNLSSNQPATLKYHCIESWTGQPTYYGTLVTGTGTVAIPAGNRASNSGFTVVQFNYNFGANSPTPANLTTKYPQFTMTSTDAGVRLEVAAGWFTSANAKGATVHPFSAGGKLTSSQLSERPNALEFYAAFAPDIVMLTCGANDQGSLTASQFQEALEAKIDAYAQIMPTALFVILTDPDRTVATNQSEWDEYAGAAKNAAFNMNDIGYQTVHINRRRIMYEKYGWDRRGSIATFLSDGVHFTNYGGRILALEDEAALFSLAGLDGHPSGSPMKPNMQMAIRQLRRR